MKSLLIGLIFLCLCGGCSVMKLSEARPEPIPEFRRPDEPVKVALVLGGGGSKGLAHVGVLMELEQAGIHPDLIVGCSSGAIIGALYADQPHVDRLERLLIGLKRSDLMDFSLFASRFGLVKGLLLQTFLSANLKARTFDQFQIPFIAVATDLATGELVELGGGEAIPAIQASAAVPGVFSPIFYLGRYLVDGGVADPIPVATAKKHGARVIIAVDVGEDLSQDEPAFHFGVARRSLEISHRKLSEYVCRDADVVIRMKFQDLGMFNDRHNQEIYEHGRNMARAMLPHIEQVIQERLSYEAETVYPTWMEIE